MHSCTEHLTSVEEEFVRTRPSTRTRVGGPSGHRARAQAARTLVPMVSVVRAALLTIVVLAVHFGAPVLAVLRSARSSATELVRPAGRPRGPPRMMGSAGAPPPGR